MSERNIKYFSWFAKSRNAFINCRGVDEHEYYDEWSGKFKTFVSRQWTDLKGYKYLDEAIELATELGLNIDEAEIIRTNSTGLTIYNPKNLADRIKGMKNKREKTRAEKIAERLLYEQQSEVVN